MEKSYALILGQCSKTIRDRIEAHEQWEPVNSSSNALGLLRLIRQSLYQRATRRQETHALIEAEVTLMWFRQSERMSNSDYLEKLRDLVKVYEHLGGEPGTSKARVDSLMIDPDLADEDERQEAKTKAREEYLAVLLLTKSDPKRYATLVTDVENAYTRGQNGYPTTVSGAYDMLINYKNPNQALRMQNQDLESPSPRTGWKPRTPTKTPFTRKDTISTNMVVVDAVDMTEFRQPLQVQSHLEMPRILVQLGHIQRT